MGMLPIKEEICQDVKTVISLSNQIIENLKKQNEILTKQISETAIINTRIEDLYNEQIEQYQQEIKMLKLENVTLRGKKEE